MKIFELLKLSPFYEIILPFAKKVELINWYRRGRTQPTPQIIKQNLIKDYALKYSVDTFVETGTYLGSTTDAVKNTFDKIFTIELDRVLFKRASRKFSTNKNITVFQGDSAKLLPKVLKKIKNPAIFWLDAHYSKGLTAKSQSDTPIMAELNCILNHQLKNHIILLDDASNFKGQNDYPTICKLKSFIRRINPNIKVSFKENIIILDDKALP